MIVVLYSQIDNLPKPHGECETKQLSYTDHYSTEECYIDCLAHLQTSYCGCRDMYMPHNNGKYQFFVFNLV